jgi:hypothetical protein
MHFLAGLDEIATETQISDGWTMCVARDSTMANFTADVAATYPRSQFHGKEFRKRDEKRYRRFLGLLKQHLETTASSKLIFVLMDQSYRQQYVAAADAAVAAAVAASEQTPPELLPALQRIAPGLGELCRHVESLGAEHTIDISTDDNAITSKLHAVSIISPKSTQPIGAAPYLRAVYGAFRKLSFPNAPAMGAGGIQVVPDETSRVVQAADVVGNFAMAYLFFEIGSRGKRPCVEISDLLRGVW